MKTLLHEEAMKCRAFALGVMRVTPVRIRPRRKSWRLRVRVRDVSSKSYPSPDYKFLAGWGLHELGVTANATSAAEVATYHLFLANMLEAL